MTSIQRQSAAILHDHRRLEQRKVLNLVHHDTVVCLQARGQVARPHSLQSCSGGGQFRENLFVPFPPPRSADDRQQCPGGLASDLVVRHVLLVGQAPAVGGAFHETRYGTSEQDRSQLGVERVQFFVPGTKVVPQFPPGEGFSEFLAARGKGEP